MVRARSRWGRQLGVGGNPGPLIWVMLVALGLFLTPSLLSCPWRGGVCCGGGAEAPFCQGSGVPPQRA